jgi:hypothetical protein
MGPPQRLGALGLFRRSFHLLRRPFEHATIAACHLIFELVGI